MYKISRFKDNGRVYTGWSRLDVVHLENDFVHPPRSTPIKDKNKTYNELMI